MGWRLNAQDATIGLLSLPSLSSAMPLSVGTAAPFKSFDFAMTEVSFLFDYEVPRHLVAQEPLRHRADARLMVIDRRRQQIEHHHVRDLPHLLPSGDRLVLNNTKVVPAQLAGRRSRTGGRWQGLFLEATADGHWRILCKTRGRLSPGEEITLTDREGRPGAKLWLIERLDEGQWLAHVETDESTDAILNRLGRVPLPPYIRGGNMVDADVASYQTVYAERPGAIAAPTAGLHFTKELLKALEARGVGYSRVTLHVGLGTFRPIESAIVGRASHAQRDGRDHAGGRRRKSIAPGTKADALSPWERPSCDYWKPLFARAMERKRRHRVTSNPGTETPICLSARRSSFALSTHC